MLSIIPVSYVKQGWDFRPTPHPTTEAIGGTSHPRILKIARARHHRRSHGHRVDRHTVGAHLAGAYRRTVWAHLCGIWAFVFWLFHTLSPKNIDRGISGSFGRNHLHFARKEFGDCQCPGTSPDRRNVSREMWLIMKAGSSMLISLDQMWTTINLQILNGPRTLNATGQD